MDLKWIHLNEYQLEQGSSRSTTNQHAVDAKLIRALSGQRRSLDNCCWTPGEELSQVPVKSWPLGMEIKDQLGVNPAGLNIFSSGGFSPSLPQTCDPESANTSFINFSSQTPKHTLSSFVLLFEWGHQKANGPVHPWCDFIRLGRTDAALVLVPLHDANSHYHKTEGKKIKNKKTSAFSKRSVTSFCPVTLGIVPVSNKN